MALEHRDLDLDTHGSLRPTRMAATVGSSARSPTASIRAVPLQAIALEAIAGRSPPHRDHGSSSRTPPAATSTCTTSALPLETRPARGGNQPARRIYDLRHTFATFALRAGISTFDLSRYMGASLTMIDRDYGHLARDGREHAIRSSIANAPTVPTSTPWTFRDT